MQWYWRASKDGVAEGLSNWPVSEKRQSYWKHSSVLDWTRKEISGLGKTVSYVGRWLEEHGELHQKLEWVSITHWGKIWHASLRILISYLDFVVNLITWHR